MPLLLLSKPVGASLGWGIAAASKSEHRKTAGTSSFMGLLEIRGWGSRFEQGRIIRNLLILRMVIHEGTHRRWRRVPHRVAASSPNTRRTVGSSHHHSGERMGLGVLQT